MTIAAKRRGRRRASAGGPRPLFVTSVELACLACGHAYGGVRVPFGRHHTDAEPRRTTSDESAQPVWDAHGKPRCPHCQARLFIEHFERRRVYAAPAAHPQRRQRPSAAM
jgi:hypothetical protein